LLPKVEAEGYALRLQNERPVGEVPVRAFPERSGPWTLRQRIHNELAESLSQRLRTSCQAPLSGAAEQPFLGFGD